MTCKVFRYHQPALFASAIVASAVFCIFIWALTKQGNIGPLWNDPDDTFGIKLSRSEMSWTMMWMVTRGIGSWASGILYQSGTFLSQQVGTWISDTPF